MTPDTYKELATANGYDLGAKTDKELLSDYAFHKAACTGMEDEVFNSVKDAERGFAMASFHKPHRIRLMVALDGFDAGKSEDEIWAEVCLGSVKKSECHDAEGNLIISKL